MVFSSHIFIFYFLPAAVAAYYLSPNRVKHLTLTLFSYVFYGWANPYFVVLMLVYDAPFTSYILYLAPITIVLTMFATAVSLVFSATQVRFRDIGVAVPLLLQLWMFATPVVYPLDVVPARVRQLYLLNPMVGFVETWRQVTVGARPPDLRLLGLATVVSTVLLVVAYVYFKHREATVADVI